jgi:hypothetical protein
MKRIRRNPTEMISSFILHIYYFRPLITKKYKRRKFENRTRKIVFELKERKLPSDEES